MPESGVEVESISKLLHEKSWQVQLYEGPLAVEEAVKGAHSPRVLHIATQAFYLPLSESDDANSTNELPAGLDDPSFALRSLFCRCRCGVIGSEPASGR